MIIVPKLDEIEIFYNGISNLKLEIKTNDLNEIEKIRIINKVKKFASEFRKNFIASLQHLAPLLFTNIQENIDKLTDDLTNAITNDELKLCNEKTYNREIYAKIQSSYSSVLKQIFEYQG